MIALHDVEYVLKVYTMDISRLIHRIFIVVITLPDANIFSRQFKGYIIVILPDAVHVCVVDWKKKRIQG